MTRIFDFAKVADWDDRLQELADMAEPERWKYLYAPSRSSVPVLDNYVKYTFVHARGNVTTISSKIRALLSVDRRRTIATSPNLDALNHCADDLALGSPVGFFSCDWRWLDSSAGRFIAEPKYPFRSSSAPCEASLHRVWLDARSLAQCGL